MSATVLIVDDEKNIRRTLRMVLEGEEYVVLEAGSGEEAEELCQGSARIDVILMDIQLPGRNGIETLERMRSSDLNAGAPIIMISGHATVDDAVRATRLGAFDFLEKPLDRERTLVSVRNAVEHGAMRREVGELRAQVHSRFEMVGKSRPIQALFQQIAKVAPTRGRVLITGESGTGKELIARAIHRSSTVAHGPFVKVNCAAIPAELIESELFGHERGAFTGAVARKRGLFEQADGGTIFLDEIGDMTPSAQAKVLRVLQTGELTRVGGERMVKVDPRVIAATNKDLSAEVAAGRFRDDLFFRLNVVPLHSPPLRERSEDVSLLAEAFVEHCCQENGFRKKILEPSVVRALSAYKWPGNVRELRNVIERLVIMSDDVITERDLADMFPQGVSSLLTGSGGGKSNAAPQTFAGVAIATTDETSLRDFRDEAERLFVIKRLDETAWNISKTAQKLGIERTNLHKKMRALGIARGDAGESNGDGESDGESDGEQE